jgi:hypothetical protein
VRCAAEGDVEVDVQGEHVVHADARRLHRLHGLSDRFDVLVGSVARSAADASALDPLAGGVDLRQRGVARVEPQLNAPAGCLRFATQSFHEEENPWP